MHTIRYDGTCSILFSEYPVLDRPAFARATGSIGQELGCRTFNEANAVGGTVVVEVVSWAAR